MKSIRSLAVACTLLVSVLQNSSASDAPAAPEQIESFSLKEADQAPKVKQPQARPKYPRDMRRANISGSVVVQFIVSKEGNVIDAKAVKSSHPEFIDAAVEAVSKWKYEPALKDGRAVNCRMMIPIQFNLNNR